MPIIIRRASLAPAETIPGRLRFNAAVEKMAPSIAEARENGHHGIAEIVQHLNDKGILAPNGQPFNNTTLWRILKRLKQLGLADGPRSVSQAVSARPGEKLARLKREHPEWKWLEGL
jgi:hypothetical protein